MTPRAETNFGYRLLRAIYPVFRMVFPNQVIRADDLARAMVDVAVQPTKERRALVFENNDLLAMVEWNRHTAITAIVLVVRLLVPRKFTR